MALYELDKVKNPQMRRQLESVLTKVAGYANLPIISSDVFFVSSVTGSDNNSGEDIDAPKATIDSAVGMCSAGDVIFVLPGHTETHITTGSKIVSDVAGIYIIGLGEGSLRPTISFGHTGTTTTFSAANVTVCNLLFVTAIDSVVTYGTISGNDNTFIGCEFRDATDKEVINDFIVTGDRFKAIGIFKNGYTAGDANVSVFSMNGVDNAIIEQCRFMTKVTTSIIRFVTTACTNIIVKDSVFFVSGTSSTKNIVDTIGGSSWIAVNCSDMSTGSSFNGGSSFPLNNYPSIDYCKTVTIADGTTIPNNVQAAAGLLATALGGAILIEEIIWQRGADNFVGPTNYEFSTDNVAGLTGAAAPNGVAILAKFNAAKTGVLSLDGTTKQLPFVLENTKKLYIHGDDAATSAGGPANFYIKYKKLSSGAYLLGGGV